MKLGLALELVLELSIQFFVLFNQLVKVHLLRQIKKVKMVIEKSAGNEGLNCFLLLSANSIFALITYPHLCHDVPLVRLHYLLVHLFGLDPPKQIILWCFYTSILHFDFLMIRYATNFLKYYNQAIKI